MIQYSNSNFAVKKVWEEELQKFRIKRKIASKISPKGIVNFSCRFTLDFLKMKMKKINFSIKAKMFFVHRKNIKSK